MIFSREIPFRIIFIFTITLSVATCANYPANNLVPAQESSEQLLAKPPDDWKLIYQLNNPSARLSDFVPPQETAFEWTTKLSFESSRVLVDSDPIQVLLAEADLDQKNCRFVQHFNLFSGLENNFPASVRLFLCGENTLVKKGEVKMIKAIAGNDYFYLIRILKRIEPFDVDKPEFAKAEVAEWSSYIRNISLCDPGKPEHPCPGN